LVKDLVNCQTKLLNDSHFLGQLNVVRELTSRKGEYMKQKKLITIAIALVAALGLSVAPADAVAKQKVLGMVALVATDSLNKAVIDGATTVAKANGWKVVVTDTQGSPAKANSAMIAFATTQKVDAIIVMAFHSSALGAGLAAANKAHIPVGSWGGELAPGVVVTTSAAAAGTTSANGLLKLIGTKGAVLALQYHTGVLCYFRGQSFDSIMAANPNITVTNNEVQIPGQVQSGQSYTAAWLASHPAGGQSLGIWGTWDEPAMGAIAALKQAGRTDVHVVAINGGPQALAAVQDGSLDQVVWQNGVEEGVQIMKGVIASIKAGKTWSAKVVNIPALLIDKNNIASFLSTHPNAMS
jgi:ribose transport system substrate-binding protein